MKKNTKLKSIIILKNEDNLDKKKYAKTGFFEKYIGNK